MEEAVLNDDYRPLSDAVDGFAPCSPSEIVNGEASRNPAVVTAVLLMKGALAKVLGYKIGKSCVGTHYSEGNRARITVATNMANSPTESDLVAVVQLANEFIARNVPVYAFKIGKKDAELAYGDAMFDRNEPQVTSLCLSYIPELILNCSNFYPLHSLGPIQSITITKSKFTATKKQLEINIQVQPIFSQSDYGRSPHCHAPTSGEIRSLNSHREEAKQPVVSELMLDESKSAAASQVTPWDVDDGTIDYEKLIVSFGTSRITPDLLHRWETVTRSPPHHWLRRQVFYSHRDLNRILDVYESGRKFYLYTGRGPSTESLHLGHLLPFLFTKHLQDLFHVPLVIQLTDDEKFLFKDNLTLEDCHRMAFENAKDIIACGFDPDLTFIFTDLDYIHDMYPNIVKIQKCVTFNQARGIFGFTESDSIGMISYPATQAAPALSSSFPLVLNQDVDINKKMPCLIPCAIDQDAFFRMTRDVCPRLGFDKPALIHSKFFPGLTGAGGKMSSSVNTSAVIYVTDTPDMIAAKIKKHAFSGGQETLELQRERGADLTVDVAFQYLSFFLEDDEELNRIASEYGSGRMLTGQVKEILIRLLTDLVGKHQAARALVTNEVVDRFMRVRRLNF